VFMMADGNLHGQTTLIASHKQNGIIMRLDLNDLIGKCIYIVQSEL